MLKDRIREARKRAGYSQEKLGQLMGISKQTISDYERGYSQPDMAKLGDLMHFLNVDANYLLQDGSSVEEYAPSDKALSIARRFDLLDDHGMEVVSAVVDLELKRCEN